jgi:hypothetical protein
MKTEEEFSLDKHQIMSYLDLTEGKRRDYIEQILGSNNRTTSKDREFTREVMRSAEKDTDTGLPVLVAGSFAGFDSEVFFTIAKNQKMDTVYKVRFRPDHGIKPEVKYSEGRMQISRSSIFQPSESDGLTVVVHLPEYIDVVELTYPDVVRFEFKCRHPEKMAILNDQLSSLLNKDLSNLVVSESLRVDYSGFRAGFQEQPTPERKYSLFPENLRLRYEGSSASEEFLSVRQDQNAYIFSVTSEKDECVWFTGQIGGGSERRHFTYLLRRTGQIEQIFQSPDYCSKGGQNDHRR